MITNLIYFLYNIKIEYIRKSKDSYIFFYDNSFYIFKQCYITEDYLLGLYNYINDKDGLYHSIIKSRYNKLISNYNNNSYILMKVKVNSNRLLLLEDIYSNKNVSYIKKNSLNWSYLWKLKVDQVEYIVNNNNNFSIIVLSIINYYIGIADIAINIFENINNSLIPLTLCHKRIYSNCDLYEYYGVTNLIIDHVTRDMGEYIKSDIYNNKKIDLSKYGIIKNISLEDKYLLLSRILFPSYFFDIFDDFILNNKDFIDFNKYFIDIDVYEKNLIKTIKFILK